jgi:hypothetical protein
LTIQNSRSLSGEVQLVVECSVCVVRLMSLLSHVTFQRGARLQLKSTNLLVGLAMVI